MTPPFWLSEIANLAEVVAVLIAAAGLIYTGKQLQLSRKATGAQLLLQVDEALREFDGTAIGLRDGTLKGDEREVQRLMGTMERLHVLITKGLVDAVDIDTLHGWRLEALLGSEYVRAYISEYEREWWRLTDLERILAEARERPGR